MYVVFDSMFYTFAAVLLLCAVLVVTIKNPVHAALFLIVAFVNASFLWMMLGIEFLSLTLILVYVGAVMVLFLFVVMMLDIDVEEMRKGFWKAFPLALVLGLVVLAELVLVIMKHPLNPIKVDQNIDIAHMSPSALGWSLYTNYSYPVELASLILLLGLVVAVALTLRETNKGTKYQNIAKQVAVNSKDRWKLVKMDPVVEEVTQEEGEQK